MLLHDISLDKKKELLSSAKKRNLVLDKKLDLIGELYPFGLKINDEILDIFNSPSNFVNSRNRQGFWFFNNTDIYHCFLSEASSNDFVAEVKVHEIYDLDFVLDCNLFKVLYSDIEFREPDLTELVFLLPLYLNFNGINGQKLAEAMSGLEVVDRHEEIRKVLAKGQFIYFWDGFILFERELIVGVCSR